MKVSQNLIAETLRARIGLASDVPDVDPLAAASGAYERTLAAWGVPVEDVIVADGSGLSRYDYLTADALVAVLRRMAQEPRHAAAFEATLPILGVDGTLERRLRGTRAAGPRPRQDRQHVERPRAGRLRDDDRGRAPRLRHRRQQLQGARRGDRRRHRPRPGPRSSPRIGTRGGDSR